MLIWKKTKQKVALYNSHLVQTVIQQWTTSSNFLLRETKWLECVQRFKTAVELYIVHFLRVVYMIFLPVISELAKSKRKRNMIGRIRDCKRPSIKGPPACFCLWNFFLFSLSSAKFFSPYFWPNERESREKQKLSIRLIIQITDLMLFLFSIYFFSNTKKCTSFTNYNSQNTYTSKIHRFKSENFKTISDGFVRTKQMFWPNF